MCSLSVSTNIILYPSSSRARWFVRCNLSMHRDWISPAAPALAKNAPSFTPCGCLSVEHEAREARRVGSNKKREKKIRTASLPPFAFALCSCFFLDSAIFVLGTLQPMMLYLHPTVVSSGCPPSQRKASPSLAEGSISIQDLVLSALCLIKWIMHHILSGMKTTE